MIGLVNGTFGAGGGMIAVPALKKLGFEQKSAQENAIAVILPITLLSAAIYLMRGYVRINQSFAFIPTGLLGALVATYIMKKISPNLLKRIFGGFMIYAGVRLLIK